MPGNFRQPAFPLWTSLAALTAAAAGVYGLAAWAVPVLFDRPADAFAGVSLMAGIVWFSLVLALLPVAVAGPLGVMPTIFAYFSGAGARFVICLVSGAVLVRVGKFPAGPVMVTLAGMYIPLLFLEAALVGRYLWAKDFLKAAPGNPGNPGTPGTPGSPGSPAPEGHGKEALA